MSCYKAVTRVSRLVAFFNQVDTDVFILTPQQFATP